jgi:hypothetical protein
MTKNIAFALALGFATTAGLSFGTAAEAKWGWGVNGRQNRQQNRIGNGVSNGSLNMRETKRLEKQQRKLANQEARMRASGGGLSGQERSTLEREQNQLSKNIYNQKHDAQTR